MVRAADRNVYVYAFGLVHEFAVAHQALLRLEANFQMFHVYQVCCSILYYFDDTHGHIGKIWGNTRKYY